MAKNILSLALRDLVPMNAALTTLAAREDLPITTSFRLAVFLNQAKTHFDTFDKARAAIVKKYGTPNEQTPEQVALGQGPTYTMEPEVQELANADMDKLANETVTFTGWRPLSLSDFGDAKGIRPADFLTLRPLLDLGTEADDEAPNTDPAAA